MKSPVRYTLIFSTLALFCSWPDALAQQPAEADSARVLPAFFQPNSAAQTVQAKPSPACFSVTDDPLVALQGQVAGLAVARTGSNPNENYSLRLRGNTSFSGNTAPQIWLDQVPIQDVNLLIATDLHQFTVLKDVASTAAFGPRTAPGMVLAEAALLRRGHVRLAYTSEVGFSADVRRLPVASAEAFLAAGGTNFTNAPGRTDWLPLIFRENTVSHTHKLGMDGGTARTQWRLDFGYQDRQGVLRFSGYEQATAHAAMQHEAFGGRLRLHARWLGRFRQANLSHPEATRYAITFNPTAAVRSNAPDFAIFGGYAQAPFFDYQNPVALLEQNLNLAETGSWAGILGATAQLAKGLEADLRWSPQARFDDEGAYSPPDACWRIAYLRQGWAKAISTEAFGQFGEAALRYRVEKGRTAWLLTGKMTQQATRWQQFGAAGGRLFDLGGRSIQSVQDIFSINIGDVAAGDGQQLDVDSTVTNTGWLAQADFALDRWWSLTLGLREERSPALRDGASRAAMPFFRTAVDFLKIKNPLNVNELRARLSWGNTANMPQVVPGSWQPSNATLGWERKRELSFGLDASLAQAGLRGALDFFKNHATNLIHGTRWSSGISPKLSIENRGWECTLAWKKPARENQKLRWETALNLWRTRSFFRSVDEQALGDMTIVGAPGNGGTFYHIVQDGGELGALSMWMVRVESSGNLSYVDVNKNGVVAEPGDKVVAGQGNPRLSLGWTQHIGLGRWALDFRLRGIFGHSLVHEYRGFYEVGPKNFPYQNSIRTKYFNPKLNYSVLNSGHVERATFLRLDHVRLSHKLSLKTKKGSEWPLTFYVGAENLFTASKYTGNDPELRLQTKQPEDNGNSYFPENFAHPSALSIDRRGTYPLARTWAIGLVIW